MEKIRANLTLSGIVQGVGLRPFIHKLANKLNLCGFIRNTSSGVEIEIEGYKDDVNKFINCVQNESPGAALIESIWSSYCEDLAYYRDFKIKKSVSDDIKFNSLISPDIGICDKCKKELLDAKDKRYRYPFINCSDCGPRFSIIKKVPYDREKTTMAEFIMCDDCRAEYEDIDNRRYHAQPVCCKECGPEIFYLDSKDKDGFAKIASGYQAIEKTAHEILNGKIVAIKGIGGFHLACRADDENIVNELRKKKQRDEKPFAVMVENVFDAEKLCILSNYEKQALSSAQRPVVLLEKKENNKNLHLSENKYLGIMLPYAPVHYLLFQILKNENADFPLVMTSANFSEMPMIYKNDEAEKMLSGICSGILSNDREIETGCDDSVLWIIRDRQYFMRRSRGYVPYPVILEKNPFAIDEAEDDERLFPPHILACGAEQKACFALVKERYAFMSQHIGDLKNVETLEYFEAQIKHFENLFDISPSIFACDLHPDYLSSEFALKAAGDDAEILYSPSEIKDHSFFEDFFEDSYENLMDDIRFGEKGCDESTNKKYLVKVQHHHAHMTSCMAENGLTEKCIGIIWDGTGYGIDGSIWGGEFLVGDYSGFKRCGSLIPFRLPGGDKAIKEIWRTGVSVIYESFGLNKNKRNKTVSGNFFEAHEDFPSSLFSGKDVDNIIKMLDADINCPVCTSIGRLFDAVAAILSIKDVISYEGQGAVLVEAYFGKFINSKFYSDAGLLKILKKYKMVDEDVDEMKFIAQMHDGFPYEIIKDEFYHFDFTLMIREMISFIKKFENVHKKFGGDNSNDEETEEALKGFLAFKFMNTLINMAMDIVKNISEDTDITKVVLSGGSFQNEYILRSLIDRLADEDFQVYFHKEVSANDSGIALGQAMVAREAYVKSYLPMQKKMRFLFENPDR